MVQGVISAVLANLNITNVNDIDGLFEQPSRKTNFIVFLSEIIPQVPRTTASITLLQSVEALIRIVLNTNYDTIENPLWQRAMITLMYRASWTTICRSAPSTF